MNFFLKQFNMTEHQNKHVFLTTAINYTNGVPHIGHLFEGLIGDFYSRHLNFKFSHTKTYFQTGTDEHGLKIAKKAKELGISPLDLCNQNVLKFQKLTDCFEIKHDNFIRTTDPKHLDLVQKIFTQLYKQGDIYLSQYGGWYSSREEKYLTPSEAELSKHLDPVTGEKLDYINEPSYFFRLSKYQDQIYNYLFNNPNNPVKRTNLIEQFQSKFKDGIQDISITRTKFSWGVPVPKEIAPDQTHTIYVWFDALLNYLTGNENPEAEMVHLIGEDILWFHSVIWIGILLALELPLPKEILVHSFVVDKDGKKMSKSVGNVIDPLELVDQYPNYLIRGYLLSNAILRMNFRFSIKKMIDFNNGVLADQIGNLINRLTTLLKKYTNSCLVSLNYQETLERFPNLDFNLDFLEKYYSEIDNQNLHDANDHIYAIFRNLNYWLTLEAPWKINGNSIDDILKKNQIIRMGLERFFLGLHFLEFIFPNKTEELFALFNSSKYNSLSDIKTKFSQREWLLSDGLEIPKSSVIFPKFEH